MVIMSTVPIVSIKLSVLLYIVDELFTRAALAHR